MDDRMYCGNSCKYGGAAKNPPDSLCPAKRQKISAALRLDTGYTVLADCSVPADDKNCEFRCVDGSVYAKP